MSPPSEITVGDMRWWVAPECRDLLFGPDGLRLDEWLRHGQASVVKQGTHRAVYRIDLPGLRCHLKHNRVGDLRTWLRSLVRPSKARTEYRRALKVAARGVPTVVPLALGEGHGRAGPRDSFLLTRTLDGALMFHAFVDTALPALAPPRRARLRQRLAVRMGEFLARLHHAGIVHRDLHTGNILVQLDADEEPHLYLVDLHAVTLKPPLDWPASRDNLVLLSPWPYLYAGRTDRLRCWRAYCRARAALDAEGSAAPVLPPEGLRPEWARDLEQRVHDFNREFWRDRDRRCLARNRYYRPVRAGAVAGHAMTDVDAQALADLLADPDAPFRRPARPLLKDSRSSTVAELVLPVGGRPCPVIYKRFRVTSWRDPWAAWLRQPPALRSWIHGHGLRERGVPTARPLAVFHRRRFGLYSEAYILFEKIPDALDLRGAADCLAAADGATRLRNARALVEELARIVRRLHHCGLSHRDLKAANVLVRLPRSAEQRPQCWLIDLVGVALHRKLPHRVRIKDLARLNASFLRDRAVSRSDRLRFLRTYLDWGLRGRQGWKTWWRAVERATRAKVARNARSGRPLA